MFGVDLGDDVGRVRTVRGVRSSKRGSASIFEVVGRKTWFLIRIMVSVGSGIFVVQSEKGRWGLISYSDV